MRATEPNLDDIYSLVGFALGYTQVVERILRFVTTFVLQDGETLSIEKLQSLETKEAKKTLGYFMAKIRERTELYPGLDRLLETYLKDRNDFIHNHSGIPGWDLSATEGVAIARLFVSKLLRDGHKINEIFIALIMSWQDQVEMRTLDIQNESDFFRSIDSKYRPLVDVFFTAKETD